jgi:hypothetical protein
MDTSRYIKLEEECARCREQGLLLTVKNGRLQGKVEGLEIVLQRH